MARKKPAGAPAARVRSRAPRYPLKDRDYNAPFFDLDPVDVGPLIRAAEHFLERNAEYEEFLAGPGRDSREAVLQLVSEAYHAWQLLQDAVRDAGLMATSRFRGSGAAGRWNGLTLLSGGVRRLDAASQGSPRARSRDRIGVIQSVLRVPEGKTFHFHPTHVEEIKLAVRLLRQEPPRAAGGGPAPGRPERSLNPTETRILSLIRRKALAGPAIARKVGLTEPHVRRVMARLGRAGRVRTTGRGYRPT
jgi:hypothetical protein